MNRGFKDIGYFISIKDGDHGDTEAFIKKALEHEMIFKWAYILHDKDTYNDHDLRARYYFLQRCWADGFKGMEKYASMHEYIEKMMAEPPFPGDKTDPYWRIVCIVDKKCYDAEIEEIFEVNKNKIPLPDFLRDRVQITNRLKKLTHEDDLSQTLERYRYPDAEVKASFDFRDYITNTKDYSRWDKFKEIFRPAPFKPRRRSW